MVGGRSRPSTCPSSSSRITPREPLPKQGGTSFTFVTDGIEAALEQARAAAGDKDVAIGGGASVIQQALKAGQLDELRLHVAPILLGGGTRLFERARDRAAPARAGRRRFEPAMSPI